MHAGIVALTLAASAAAGVAEPIEFVFSGQATGSVDGVPFEGAFEACLLSDTDDVYEFGANV